MAHTAAILQSGLSGRPRTRPISAGPQACLRARLYRAVAAAFDVPLEELEGRSRRADVALARQTAMYLARVVLAMSLSDVGRMFGRDRTTAAHACRIIEDLRDQPRMDALLSTLEALVGHQQGLRFGQGGGQ